MKKKEISVEPSIKEQKGQHISQIDQNDAEQKNSDIEPEKRKHPVVPIRPVHDKINDRDDNSLLNQSSQPYARIDAKIHPSLIEASSS